MVHMAIDDGCTSDLSQIQRPRWSPGLLAIGCELGTAGERVAQCIESLARSPMSSALHPQV